MRGNLLLLSLVCVVACSKAALKYADDVDVPELEAQFECGKAPLSGDRVEACRVLEDFAAAGSVTQWPSGGVESWYGRMYCKLSLDDKTKLENASIHLAPGRGTFIGSPDVRIDESKVVPNGAVVMHGGSYVLDANRHEASVRLFAAASSGKPPDFTGVPDFDRIATQSWWDEVIRKPPKDNKFYLLVKSNGASILATPYVDEKFPSAYQYLRGSGQRILLAIPAREPGQKTPRDPCVGELFRVQPPP